MIEYIPKAYNGIISKWAYDTAAKLIANYAAIEEELENMIDEKHQNEVKTSNVLPSNPTLRIVEQREPKKKIIMAIDKAYNTIPAEFQKMVEKNIVEKVPLRNIDYASKNTVSKYRRKVIIETAHNLGFIDDLQFEEIRKVEMKKK